MCACTVVDQNYSSFCGRQNDQNEREADAPIDSLSQFVQYVHSHEKFVLNVSKSPITLKLQVSQLLATAVT